MIPFWMRMSCILLLTSGREGRIYNGRKKPSALTAQRLRSGPHVCFSGMGSGCCPGWTISPGTGQCLQPLCSFGCGGGYCIAPNVCSCRDGHQGVTCTDHYATEYNKEIEDKGFTPSCLSALCDQGCKVINGIAMCTCFHGYILGKDGKNCYDIDECSRPQALNPCHQQCKNNIGSYRCICYYGYQISANGRTCLPTKHPNTIAAPGPCGEYGCELSCNDGGCEHVSRVCPLGFRMTETANGVTCTNINDCAASTCEGTCRNTEGGFVCDCGPGLKLAADRTSCLDIDECLTQRSVCQHRCKNIHGSYRCLCGTGFTLQNNGHTCADINECRRPGSSQLCQHFCHNTYGSFFCSCQAGFVLSIDRVSCVDVNECLENTTLCISGSCMNTLGSYVCSCPDGFQSINGGCSATPLETKTASLLQAVHSDWMPLSLTPPMSASIETPTTSASQTDLTSTKLPQEIFTTKSTSMQPTTTKLDPVPPPQHLKTGHSSLSQKSSGISPMPLKENIIIPTGQPTVLGTNVPCWHNRELRLAGSTWTESGCSDCICKEGKVSCARRVCNPDCSHPVLTPESCCPSCDGCLFEGKLRADGELFPITPDNCTVCICLAGNITCIPPVCPPVACTEPVMSDCCLQCPDGCEFQGNIYPHGATFSRDENGCTSCLCQNGVVECSFLPCPSLECPREDWVLETGQCCFKCQQPSPSTGCPFDDNGIEIPVGQIWSPGDPCSICICQADSTIVCKKTDCVETCPHPIIVPGQCCPDCSAGCSYGRRTYRNNESFPSTSDPCLTCICLVGTVACSPIECAPNCTYPFHDEGECCPVCRDCTYEGRKVLNHQTFSLESEPCTQCTCQEGEVQCEAMSCSTTCSHPYIFPGECCAACEECTFEGHVLENGGSYILKSDPCVVCHCYAGNVQCEQSEGSCTPCEQKTQDCQNEVSEPFNTKQLQYSPQNAGQVNVPLKILSATKSPAFGRLSLSQKLKERRNLVTAASFSPVSRSVPSDHVSHSESVSALEHKLNSNTVPHIQIHPVPPGEEKVSVHSYVHMSSTPSGVSVSPSLPGQPVPTSETIKDTTSHPTSNWSLWSFHSNLFSDSQTSATVADPSLFPATTSTSGHPQSYTPSSSSQATVANRASAKDVLMPLRDRGTLSPSMNDSNTPLYTSKAQEESGPTTRHTDYVYQLTDVAKLSFEKMENAEETDYEPRLLTECSFNGLSSTNGSIYVADEDYCLQCECLRSEIYCRAEAHYFRGLCCDGCYHLFRDPCSKETNQIYSEQGEVQGLCKCQNILLQCRTCSFDPDCITQGASQSSESEHKPKAQISVFRVAIKGMLKLWDENSSP
ncbi:von Willebrand factor C and EGF domain-containing protein isoform X1 [Aquarana catesbeiana]|uniref:von Willebrand factor C and EGF domain-containing protein isoform X1 n=1 Tax=Aquarana catesbeiana TaxID=8400 RepID=UPI003CCA0333